MVNFEKERSLDIICLGRAGVDLNPNEINCPIEESMTFTKSVGGSPANIAVGAAKMGMKVGFIGRIANNGFGRYISKYFDDLGIDTTGIVVDEEHNNGLALTEIKAPDNCGVILYRENVADLKLNCKDISEDYIKNAKALVISGTALSQSPSREATLLAIEYARRNNTKVIMDIDYRPYSWNSEEDTSLYYTLACNKCDIIIGTREEFSAAEYLWNRGEFSDRERAKCWLEKLAELVVIKDGENGSTSYLKNGDEIKVGIVPTNLRKTFGAGDAYASSFVSALIKGYEISKSMLNGSGSASIVISKTDCTEAMPTEDELENYLKEKMV